MSATGSDALGAQALVGGKGETCDASMGVGGARGDGAAPAGRDGGVCGRGLGAGWDVAPKHTPGPWEVPEGGFYPIIASADGDHIATLAGTGDMMEANASLIAAAPTMLNTLSDAETTLVCVAKWLRENTVNTSIAEIAERRAAECRTAIALAVGSAS